MASGVLAAVTAVVAPKWYGQAADLIGGWRGVPGLEVHLDHDGGFEPMQSSVWALADAEPRIGVDRTADLRAAGAVAVGATVVAVTLDNRLSRDLTVTSIRAVIDGPRRAPLAGARVQVAPGGGGAEPPPINLGFDLDTDDLEARVTTGGRLTAVRYLDKHGVTLKPGEHVRLRLAGRSDSYFVAWSAEVTYLVGGGGEHRTAIGGTGQFRVTAKAGRYDRTYETSVTGWQELPADGE